MDDLGLITKDGKRLGFLVIRITERDGASVPSAFSGASEHGRRDALARHVAFELRKDENNLEHSLSHCGRCVKLLILRHERHADPLALRVHGRKIEQIAADAVDLPDEDMRKLTLPDARHHILKRRAVRILAGIARVLEDLIILDREHVACIVDHIRSLQR